MATTEFLKDLLSGRKRMVRMQELRPIDTVEKFEELSLQSLLNYGTMHQQNLFEYLPNNYEVTKLSRSYVINVGSH